MKCLALIALWPALLLAQSNPQVVVVARSSWGAAVPAEPRISTYFGYALGIEDSANVPGPGPHTITPPADMASGDLVIISQSVRLDQTNSSIYVHGGQAWDSSLTMFGSYNNAIRMFWCKFDGTWDASPQFVSAGTTEAFTPMMHVFRPADGATRAWAIDTTAAVGFDAPADPFDVTAAGVTTTYDSSVVVVVFATPDDNSWLLQTAGWMPAEPYSGLQNTAGSDNSIHLVYKIQQAKGATGNVVDRQTARGGDAGGYRIVVFK